VIWAWAARNSAFVGERRDRMKRMDMLVIWMDIVDIYTVGSSSMLIG
jgi:hypothetical protein